MSNLLSGFGERNYNKENHEQKIEKIYFINTTNHNPQIH